MSTIIQPVPGDPATEPVATAAQSHVAGRVGPPTVEQDASTGVVHEGVVQVEPGEVLPSDYPWAMARPTNVTDEDKVKPSKAKPDAKPSKAKPGHGQ
jgi:hypothetical protein